MDARQFPQQSLNLIDCSFIRRFQKINFMSTLLSKRLIESTSAKRAAANTNHTCDIKRLLDLQCTSMGVLPKSATFRKFKKFRILKFENVIPSLFHIFRDSDLT